MLAAILYIKRHENGDTYVVIIESRSALTRTGGTRVERQVISKDVLLHPFGLGKRRLCTFECAQMVLKKKFQRREAPVNARQTRACPLSIHLIKDVLR